jgi:hypothetical protein
MELIYTVVVLAVLGSTLLYAVNRQVKGVVKRTDEPQRLPPLTEEELDKYKRALGDDYL